MVGPFAIQAHQVEQADLDRAQDRDHRDGQDHQGPGGEERVDCRSRRAYFKVSGTGSGR